MPRLVLILLAVTLSRGATGAAAQGDPRIATLGRLLEAEDRRAYVPELFEAGMRAPDPIVRRQATLGAGRIQDRRAGAPLLALLESADTTGHADAMFGLGLLGDSTLSRAIIARLSDGRPLSNGAVIEAPSTLAKLGASEARTLFSRLLDGTSSAFAADRLRLMLPGLLVEGWRFGRHAPVRAAMPHLKDTSDAVRWRAAYLLGRTRAAVGTRALLGAAADSHAWVRQNAFRGLVRIAADSASVPRDSVLAVLRAGLADSDAGVRINSLVSLLTWADSTTTLQITALLRDPVPNVRLQAVATLVGIPGRGARDAIRSIAANTREPLVNRREALLGVLRTDTTTVVRIAGELAASADPRERELAVLLAAQSRAGNPDPFRKLIRDPDSGVRAAGLGSLGVLSTELDAEIVDLTDALRDDPDDRLRAVAWVRFGRRASGPEDVRVLVAGWLREEARGRRGATGTILAALRRIHAAGGTGQQAVEVEFLAKATPPANYLLRRSAVNWPALAVRWGTVFPAEVQFANPEYEQMAARWLLNPASARPHVLLETERRGVVEVELLGDQAPLTVANFLSLVDQHAFDGGEWHRVIPNFVVQDGAGPRENGIAGRAPIRDEFNPVRYDIPVLGMALSGPDTGTSQWFINLSPQPHLDGGYTVFGRVVGGTKVLEAILQGDGIHSITRR